MIQLNLVVFFLREFKETWKKGNAAYYCIYKYFLIFVHFNDTKSLPLYEQINQKDCYAMHGVINCWPT